MFQHNHANSMADKYLCQSQLEQACNAVMRDALPIRRPAELFLVPHSTLHDRTYLVKSLSRFQQWSFQVPVSRRGACTSLRSFAEIGFARNQQQVIY